MAVTRCAKSEPAFSHLGAQNNIMRIAVIGKSGQVARALAERGAATGVPVACFGRQDVDISSPENIAKILEKEQPSVVVNAAAYTAVDQAEDEESAAFELNAVGAENVALAAARASLPVIHLSTDYVFDGDGERPYQEKDATGPLSVYGETKLEGERRVAAANAQHVILRTAWVYSPFGKNFAKTMLRLAEDRDEVSVVADQRGAPTSALDIADAILAIVQRLASAPPEEAFGVFHMTGGGEAVWADFAKAVFEASERHGGPSAEVNRIPSSQFPTKAVRPTESRLDCSKLKAVYGIALPNWRDSVDGCVQRLLTN